MYAAHVDLSIHEVKEILLRIQQLWKGESPTPLTPRESAHASPSAVGASHEFRVIGTGSGFPVPHRIELSSKPAIHP